MKTEYNIYCNKGSHIDALKFAVFCLNNGIPLDKLSEEEIEKIHSEWVLED